MTRGKSCKGIVFTTVAGAAVLALSSAAVACIAFEGKMTVRSGATSSEVVGTGSGDHDYCSIEGGATADSTDGVTGTITVSVEPYVNQGPGDPCQSSKLRHSNGTPNPTYNEPQPSWFLPPDGECANEWDIALGLVRHVRMGYHECYDGYWSDDGVGVGPYEVRLRMGNVFSRTAGDNPTYTHRVPGYPNESCAPPAENPETRWVVLGSFDVADDGEGSWTGNLPPDSNLTANGPTDSSGICVKAQLTEYDYNKSIYVGNQAPILIL